MHGRTSPVPYIVALALGIILFYVSGRQQGYSLSNMKMFASFNWGTRLLKRLFLNQARSGKDESEDYVAYRSSRGGHKDAIPLLVASAVLTALSLAAAQLP